MPRLAALERLRHRPAAARATAASQGELRQAEAAFRQVEAARACRRPAQPRAGLRQGGSPRRGGRCAAERRRVRAAGARLVGGVVHRASSTSERLPRRRHRQLPARWSRPASRSAVRRGFDFGRDYRARNDAGTTLFERAKRGARQGAPGGARSLPARGRGPVPKDPGARPRKRHRPLQPRPDPAPLRDEDAAAREHREQHARYKTDDNARDRVVGLGARGGPRGGSRRRCHRDLRSPAPRSLRPAARGRFRGETMRRRDAGVDPNRRGEIAGDDAIVGRAFRISLIALIAITAAVVAVVYLRGARRGSREGGGEAPRAAPQGKPRGPDSRGALHRRDPVRRHRLRPPQRRHRREAAPGDDGRGLRVLRLRRRRRSGSPAWWAAPDGPTTRGRGRRRPLRARASTRTTGRAASPT